MKDKLIYTYYGDVMILICNKKEIELKMCKTFFSRFKGFMLCNDIDKALLFDRCNSIHTFFMLKNIDVIMCDKNNVVMYYYKNLDKNKVIWPKKGVYKTYETPAMYFDVKINYKLEVK